MNGLDTYMSFLSNQVYYESIMIARSNWDPWNCSQSTNIAQVAKSIFIPKATAEVCVTIKDLKDTVMMPVKEPSGSWITIMDHHKLSLDRF